MPAFHALFLEWLELSEAPAAAAAGAAAAAAAITNTTLSSSSSIANATAASNATAAAAAAAAAVPDLGEWLLAKGHNITDTLWGLTQPMLAASAARALKEGYDVYCAAAGHPYDYWRRRRMGWWIGRLAAWAEGDGKDDEGEEGRGCDG